MPITSRGQARDAILDKFNTAWALLPTPPQVIWSSDTTEKPTGKDEDYARAFILHDDNRPTSVGAKNGRRHTQEGRLIVNVYATSGKGHVDMDTYTDNVEDAFANQTAESGAITFTKVDASELDSEDRGWIQSRVTVDFTYDRVR